jgi:hypothetical protein
MENKKNAIIISVYNSLLTSNREYEFCIKTWRYYCNKYNIELHLLEGDKYLEYKGEIKEDHALMCYDRWLEVDFPISEYNRITFIDADTIIRWDAFDFNKIFDENNLEIAVIHDQSGPGTPPYHFNQWLDFNPNIYSFVKGFFNAGFVSMKVEYLKDFQKALIPYKEYYYAEKDITGYVEGIGKEGGVRLDAMDNTAVCIVLQELYSDKISWLPSTFNLQLSYIYPGERDWVFWEDWNEFFKKISTFEFLNQGMVFHLGGILLSREKLVETFWNNFKEYYNE